MCEMCKKSKPRPDNEWERFEDRVKDYERTENGQTRGQ